jgi:gluconolactonase
MIGKIGIFCFLSLSAAQISYAQVDSVSATLIARQFAFTEGPSADKHGNVYFTDQPNNQIWKYDNTGKLEKWMEPAGRSNGLYVDKKGNIVACADENNELWFITPSKKVHVILKDLDGKKFNGPNDVWVSPSGTVYFTDPYYQRDYWKRTSPELLQQNVYYLNNKKPGVQLATNDVKKPNGIVGTKDGKLLYIADIGDGKIYRYKIMIDGSLSERHLFAETVSDGIAVDDAGNVYTCGNGVNVYNSEGTLIRHIKVPEKWTANACVGGKDKKYLFITASEGIYKYDL